MVDATLLAIVAGWLAVIAGCVFFAYFMATAADRSPPQKGSAMFSVIVSLATIAWACGVAVCALALGQVDAFRDGTVLLFLIFGSGVCWLAYLLGGNTFSRNNRDAKPGRSRPSASSALFPMVGLMPLGLQSLTDLVPSLHGLPVLVASFVVYGSALTLYSGSLLTRAMRMPPPARSDAHAVSR
jgi:hypothetical protein